MGYWVQMVESREENFVFEDLNVPIFLRKGLDPDT